MIQKEFWYVIVNSLHFMYLNITTIIFFIKIFYWIINKDILLNKYVSTIGNKEYIIRYRQTWFKKYSWSGIILIYYRGCKCRGTKFSKVLLLSLSQDRLYISQESITIYTIFQVLFAHPNYSRIKLSYLSLIALRWLADLLTRILIKEKI